MDDIEPDGTPTVEAEPESQATVRLSVTSPSFCLSVSMLNEEDGSTVVVTRDGTAVPDTMADAIVHFAFAQGVIITQG